MFMKNNSDWFVYRVHEFPCLLSCCRQLQPHSLWQSWSTAVGLAATAETATNKSATVKGEQAMLLLST